MKWVLDCGVDHTHLYSNMNISAELKSYLEDKAILIVYQPHWQLPSALLFLLLTY